jgi:phage terminase large subunit-like protein
LIASGTKSKVEQYIEDVLSGEIVVCKLVRQAVERHVRDLERQNSDDFPYYFNERHAQVCCDFFPMMLRHSIGDAAGMPFELEPWQAFGMWVLFGWKRVCDDSRRFRKFLKSVARKNGKSTEAAGIAIYLASMDVNPTTGQIEQVAEVILSATKKEQVEKVIYAEIERMRVRSKFIEQRSTRINRQITFTANQGSIRCVGSDKPYDGLNPLAVLMDELHAWREHHRKFYDTMQTGSGNRTQPMIGTVTTAGDDTSHLWLEEYNYAKSVLDGSIKDESFFAYVFEIDPEDDPLDEVNWIKANPNLGVSVKLDYLRDQAKQARASKIALNRFTRYHCNRLVTSTEKAFDLEQWDACRGELSDWHDADALGAGADLGGRDDLAAFGMVARFPFEERDGKPVYRYELRCRAYIATDTERDLDKQPFANWVYDGLLTKCRFPTADLRDDLIEQSADYGVHAVAYDPYNAQQLCDDLTAEGITAARMAQNYSMFNEPIRDFLQAIKDGRVRHDGNPLLRWCVGNAILIRDRTDRWMFDKRTSGEKIDPIVAIVMAYRMASLAPERAHGKMYI